MNMCGLSAFRPTNLFHNLGLYLQREIDNNQHLVTFEFSLDTLNRRIRNFKGIISSTFKISSDRGFFFQVLVLDGYLAFDRVLHSPELSLHS